MAAIVYETHGPDARAIERMVQSMGHRGPDASTVQRLPGCDLGHVRLSIIDLAGGTQPMRAADGALWIVYNGEIYNFASLKQRLERLGCRFLTNSDTEVILAGYRLWGPRILDELRGMYAFVIWDAETRQVFAARDPFGEKPLYYMVEGGSLLFASELKALVASGVSSRKIDLESIDAYLAFGYVPPDRSIYKGVSVLPPGHYLMGQQGKFHIQSYWQPVQQPSSISLPEASERLLHLLRQAVQRQLVADVPVGAFLSGGHDSTTIVALMASLQQSKVETFSVGFGKWINELPYARIAAEQYATSHHEIDLGEPPIAELLVELSRVYDEPFADSSAIPTYLISKFARRHVKVVLCGDGGDELFGGYGWYQQLQLADQTRPSLVSWLILRILSRALRERNVRLHRRSVAAGLAARWADPWTRAVMNQTYFRGRDRQQLWGTQEARSDSLWPGPLYRPQAATNGVDSAFHFDLTCYLPGNLLVKVDRASMASGLECRAPLLDRDLAEFAIALPATLKIDEQQTKIVLKSAAAHLWPKRIAERAKHGFGGPVSTWLQLPEVAALRDRVFRTGSPLRELLPGLRPNSLQATSYRTWMLLILGLWLETTGSTW